MSWFIALGCLTAALYLPVIAALVSDWWTDPDYGHGFFIPLFSCYVLYRSRERWMHTPIQPSNWGFLIMIGAVGLFLVGSLGAELFTARFSLLVLVAGIVLFLAGWRMLLAVAFPLSFLILMIPIPNIIYNQITFPLQLFASRLATFWLDLIRVPVLRDGNILWFSNYSLEVADACSGIRSLMTLISLAIIYGYLVEPRRYIRYALVLLIVPIAIVSNAIRIVGAALMARRYGPAAAAGFLHEVSGWVIFLAALSMMLVCHWSLRYLPPRQKEVVHG